MKDLGAVVGLLVDAKNFYILRSFQTEPGTTTAPHAVGIGGSSAEGKANGA